MRCRPYCVIWHMLLDVASVTNTNANQCSPQVVVCPFSAFPTPLNYRFHNIGLIEAIIIYMHTYMHACLHVCVQTHNSPAYNFDPGRTMLVLDFQALIRVGHMAFEMSVHLIFAACLPPTTCNLFIISAQVPWRAACEQISTWVCNVYRKKSRPTRPLSIVYIGYQFFARTVCHQNRYILGIG